MKKFFLLLATIAAAVSARASITLVSDTSTYLEFNFSLQDNFLSPSAATETYIPVSFPGTSFSLFFQDNLISIRPFLTGDQESFSTTPSSGTFTAHVDNGPVSFAGSYVSGGSTVDWTITSNVRTAIGNDTWAGKFVGTARATSVPDVGSTFGLFGLAFAAMAYARRKLV